MLGWIRLLISSTSCRYCWSWGFWNSLWEFKSLGYFRYSKTKVQILSKLFFHFTWLKTICFFGGALFKLCKWYWRTENTCKIDKLNFQDLLKWDLMFNVLITCAISMIFLQCRLSLVKSVGVLTLSQWKKSHSLIISWTDRIIQKFSIQSVFVTSPSICDWHSPKLQQWSVF